MSIPWQQISDPRLAGETAVKTDGISIREKGTLPKDNRIKQAVVSDVGMPIWICLRSVSRCDAVEPTAQRFEFRSAAVTQFLDSDRTVFAHRARILRDIGEIVRLRPIKCLRRHEFPIILVSEC
jgi:hypothetical protein